MTLTKSGALVSRIPRRIPRQALQVALGLLLAGSAACRDLANSSHAAGGAAGRSDVLAQVDDTLITVSEFQERINSQSPYVRARYTSLEHKKEFLDNLVKFEILAGEARKKGLDHDSEVVRTMKQVMVQQLLKREFEKVKLEDITDAEVKAYFDGHLDEFNKPAEVRTSLILVPDDARAKLVLADARLKGIENAGFRELVTQHSIDQETKERGGDLRFFDEKSRELPAEIVAASFKLQTIGDISGPIKTKNGVAILKLTGRRPALLRSVDDVRQQIRSKLFRERRAKLMDDYEKSLRKKAEVKVFTDRLSQVKVDSSAAPGAAGPATLSPPPGTYHPPGQNAPQVAPTAPPKLTDTH